MKVDRNIYPLFNFVAIFTFMYSTTPRRGLKMCIADFVPQTAEYLSRHGYLS